MNVVVSNVKGGVGKTTTSVYLSAAAVARGYDPVLLIDADRQASSAEWLEERPVEGVTIVEAPSERTLTRAMSRHDGLGIVDTPPGDERLLQSATTAADAVVIPTRATRGWHAECQREDVLPSASERMSFRAQRGTFVASLVGSRSLWQWITRSGFQRD